jgi:hypothetical protein
MLFTYFGGEPEGERQLRRTRHRLEGNIKMDLSEERWGCGLEYREMWRALVNMVKTLRVP